MNIILGKKGEAEAAAYLKTLGYVILKTNFRASMGEIDIVARDPEGVIVFVEVKYRSTFKFGTPAEAVTWQKRHKLSMTAACYIKANNLTGTKVRFDILEVTGLGNFKFNQIVNAFMSTVRM